MTSARTPSTTARGVPGWTTLIESGSLAAELQRDDLIVVDTRHALGDPEAGVAAYRQAHITGARHAHLDRDLSDHRKSGEGRHPWPNAEEFTRVLGRWGIAPTDQVVVYDAGEGALAAARLWFLMRALGHEHVAVLDGGWARWTSLGLPLDSLDPSPSASRYEGAFNNELLLDAVQVQAHLDAGGVLLDARASERFRGDVEPIDSRAGHVPGAINRPYADNLHDGKFKPADALAMEFRGLLGDRDPAEVVAMCGSGVTACHHLLAMEHAGMPGARLFTGSWSGWISDPSRPVAIGPA